jgi:hypothetical protein
MEMNVTAYFLIFGAKWCVVCVFKKNGVLYFLHPKKSAR